MLSASADISDVKPCELKTALIYIHLDTSPADLCKERAIEGASNFIMTLSIVDIVFNGIFFFFALFAFAKTSSNSKVYTVVHCCLSNFINFMNLSIIWSITDLECLTQCTFDSFTRYVLLHYLLPPWICMNMITLKKKDQRSPIL